MYKKTLINLTAITMAMSIAFAPTVTAFAAEPATETEIQSVIEPNVPANGGQEGEDVGEVIVIGEGERVEVSEGTVTVKGNPVGSESESAVEASNSSIVFVEGSSITSEGTAIEADGATVVASGDYDTYDKKDNVSGDKAGIKATNDSTVAVNGDVTGADAIISDGTGLIVVEGDVHGTSGAGFVVESAPGKNGGIVIVDGKIISDQPMSDPGKIILLTGNNYGSYTDYSSAGKKETTDENGNTKVEYDYDAIAKAIIDSFPTFYAREYNGVSIQQNYSIAESGMDTSTFYHDYLRSKYNDKTNFIIGVDTSENSNYQVLEGYDENMLKEYGLYTISGKSGLKISAKDGYTITGGENATVIDNGDNTYTVKIKGWHGGINITAVLKPATISVAANNGSEAQYVASESQEPEIVNVPVLFATLSIENSSELPEVLGASLEDGVVTSNKPVVTVKANGNLTALQYKRAFIDTVKNAPQGAIVRLETSASYCIDKMMMEALAARADLTLEVTFPVNHEKTTVVVPAGYDHMSLLDENGYCGFLYLASVFNK